MAAAAASDLAAIGILANATYPALETEEPKYCRAQIYSLVSSFFISHFKEGPCPAAAGDATRYLSVAADTEPVDSHRHGCLKMSCLHAAVGSIKGYNMHQLEIHLSPALQLSVQGLLLICSISFSPRIETQNAKLSEGSLLAATCLPYNAQPYVHSKVQAVLEGRKSTHPWQPTMLNG